MFGSLQWPELILILVILLLVFGVGRITKIGGELGSAIKSFREGLNKKDSEDKKDEPSNKAE